jgi:tRNA nucleotidyltransferase (CCA-adding enzyme)
MRPKFPGFDYTNPAIFLERLRSALPENHRVALDIVVSQPRPVFLVGGIVRDILLGRDNFDLDFVTPESAADFVQELLPRFEQAFGKNLKVQEYPPFGTVRLDVTLDLHIDFATARKETYPQSAILPQVIYPVPFEEDFRRRDFTINAIAFSGRAGIRDPYDGVRDLQEGWLRVLHPASFRDDPTRLVRGVRFAARLGYKFDVVTEELLKNALAAGYFGLLSAERKRNELRLILKELRPSEGVQLLQKYNLLTATHPLLVWDENIAAVFGKLERRPQKPAISDYLAALLHRSGLENANRIVQDLRFAGQEADTPLEVARLWESVRPQLTATTKNSYLYDLLHGYSPAALVLFAGTLTEPEQVATLRRYVENVAGRAPHLNGNDLQRLGVPRGPLVGKLLTELREVVLDGIIVGREAEEAFIRAKLAQAQ